MISSSKKMHMMVELNRLTLIKNVRYHDGLAHTDLKT